MPMRRIRRRTPIRRAVVGGAVATTAYQSGKRRARNNARLDQIEAEQAELAAAPPPPAYASAPPAYAPAPAPPAYAPAPAPSAPAPAAPPVDRMDELKKLAELKEMGVLTDEEFAVEKARILQS